MDGDCATSRLLSVELLGLLEVALNAVNVVTPVVPEVWLIGAPCGEFIEGPLAGHLVRHRLDEFGKIFLPLVFVRVTRRTQRSEQNSAGVILRAEKLGHLLDEVDSDLSQAVPIGARSTGQHLLSTKGCGSGRPPSVETTRWRRSSPRTCPAVRVAVVTAIRRGNVKPPPDQIDWDPCLLGIAGDECQEPRDPMLLGGKLCHVVVDVSGQALELTVVYAQPEVEGRQPLPRAATRRRLGRARLAA